jgi:hypothetical protein
VPAPFVFIPDHYVVMLNLTMLVFIAYTNSTSSVVIIRRNYLELVVFIVGPLLTIDMPIRRMRRRLMFLSSPLNLTIN